MDAFSLIHKQLGLPGSSIPVFFWSPLEWTYRGNMFSPGKTQKDARQPTISTRSFPGVKGKGKRLNASTSNREYRRFHDSWLGNFTSKQHSQSTFRSSWLWYWLYRIFIVLHDACKSCIMIVFRYSPNQTTKATTNLTRGYWNTSFCCNQEPCRAKRLQQQGGLELLTDISWGFVKGRCKYIVSTCVNIGLRFL